MAPIENFLQHNWLISIFQKSTDLKVYSSNDGAISVNVQLDEHISATYLQIHYIDGWIFASKLINPIISKVNRPKIVFIKSYQTLLPF